MDDHWVQILEIIFISGESFSRISQSIYHSNRFHILFQRICRTAVFTAVRHFIFLHIHFFCFSSSSRDTGYRQELFANWFADPCVNEVNLQQSRSQKPTPNISYAFLPHCVPQHGEVWHKRASESSYHPGRYPLHGCDVGSPSSVVQ